MVSVVSTVSLSTRSFSRWSRRLGGGRGGRSRRRRRRHRGLGRRRPPWSSRQCPMLWVSPTPTASCWVSPCRSWSGSACRSWSGCWCRFRFAEASGCRTVAPCPVGSPVLVGLPVVLVGLPLVLVGLWRRSGARRAFVAVVTFALGVAVADSWPCPWSLPPCPSWPLPALFDEPRPSSGRPRSGSANANAPPTPAVIRPVSTRPVEAATRNRERTLSPPFRAPPKRFVNEFDSCTNMRCKFAS